MAQDIIRALIQATPLFVVLTSFVLRTLFI